MKDRRTAREKQKRKRKITSTAAVTHGDEKKTRKKHRLRYSKIIKLTCSPLKITNTLYFPTKLSNCSGCTNDSLLKLPFHFMSTFITISFFHLCFSFFLSLSPLCYWYRKCQPSRSGASSILYRSKMKNAKWYYSLPRTRTSPIQKCQRCQYRMNVIVVSIWLSTQYITKCECSTFFFLSFSSLLFLSGMNMKVAH